MPELCYLSGLTDKLRADFRVMKDLAVVTQVAPEARRNVIIRFIQDVQSNEVAREVLNGWGLRMAGNTVNLGGRVLEPELIMFGEGKTFSTPKADWSGPATKNPMLRTVFIILNENYIRRSNLNYSKRTFPKWTFPH